MQIILEITFNIVHNTLTISTKDRNEMGKYKNLVRKIPYNKYKLDIKEGAFMQNQIFTANYRKKLP